MLKTVHKMRTHVKKKRKKERKTAQYLNKAVLNSIHFSKKSLFCIKLGTEKIC